MPRSDSAVIEQQYWGLWDAGHTSLVVARDDELISYGNEPLAEVYASDDAREKFVRDFAAA